MEIATNLGASLALSALSPLLNKLSSKFGGDVTAAEMKHLNDFVRYEIVALTREAKSDDLLQSMPLLEDLQAAALELDDLLDLYEYNQIEKQASSSSSNSVKKFVSKSKEKLRSIIPKSPLRIGLENLMKYVEQVEKIYPFIKSKTDTTQPQANTFTPKTSTLSSPFYGRGDQCDMIIKLLLDADLNSREKYVPIIAIRGLGGAGKTTTAQHLYNDNKIVNYFDLRMWVHVKCGFDERRLIKEIIESATKSACPQISNLDVLQSKLKDSVSEEKFLLVLDDVWEKDTSRLDVLLSPLNQVGEKGSKIIVTTRTEKAAKDLNAKPIFLLDELKDEDCWSILKHYAFDDNEEIIEEHQELKFVGNQIISKVKHSPLALKVVGSSLRNKRSANEWENMLKLDILKETMDLLLFSYQCLPSHLQQCFAYCSLFPKGYKFDIVASCWKPHLISLWIAQGFIENTNELTLEETGMKYIEELLSYSFFEKKLDIFFGDHLVIHDLLHDLAEKVSKKQCHRIEHHDSLHVPTTCIHLSLCIKNYLVSMDTSNVVTISDIFKLRNLRSLIILNSGSTNIFKTKKDIFQYLIKLRALFVGRCQQMEVLSDPRIDKLKHIRYLNAPYNRKLHVSLAKLYQLQFLILNTTLVDSGHYLSAGTLPHGLGNLINLRTLEFYDPNGSELDYQYHNSELINMEKLTSLQNLKKFCPDGFNRMISSLRNLPLCGSFSILNLENVKCKEEAEKAMLNQKYNVKELKFEWSSTPSSIDTCEEVLEGLEPHRHLEKLEINSYQGVKFPRWMMKENCLPRLQTLTLRFCISLKIVSFLPPRLQQLYVCECDELMQLPPLSDTLRTLWLSKCPKLTSPPMFNKSSDLGDMSFLTNLKILKLAGFPNLRALTNLSPTVIDLRIEDCPKLTSLGNLQHCTSLDLLEICKCPMLRREEALSVEGVVEGDIANRLPHVRRIKTDEPLLVFKLVQQQGFSSIERLDLRDCAALPNLEKLSSLVLLTIQQCPDVELLPNLPISLQLVYIIDCPKLKEKYEGDGPLHNTISHIPVTIS